MNIAKKTAIALCLTAGLAGYTLLVGMLVASNEEDGIAAMEMRLDGPSPCVMCTMSKVARQ